VRLPRWARPGRWQMSKAWAGAGQRTAAWKRVRLLVLVRDQHRCQIQGPKCVTVATTVDHITAKSQGGTDDPSNLRAACGPCNSSRGDGTDPEPLARW
jgi:5-methylcytosine-specific restriction protein A